MQTRSQVPGRPRLVIHLPRRAASTSMARRPNTAIDDGPGSQRMLGSASSGPADSESGMEPEERLATEQRAGSPGASEGAYLSHPALFADRLYNIGHSPQVKHRYGTRRSTQTALRAHVPGSHLRTHGGLSQAAAENHIAKRSQQDTRASKAQKRSQGMRELAKLEDQRIAEEAAEDEAMYTASTTSGYNASPISAASVRANQVHICVLLIPASIAYVHCAPALASTRSSTFARTTAPPPLHSVHRGAGTRHLTRKKTSRRP